MSDKMVLVIKLLLPMGLMVLIVWGANHRYRSTTQTWRMGSGLEM